MSTDDTFTWEAIPRKVFIDTNIVDCLVKWGECIFDNVTTPHSLDEQMREDIDALRNIFLIGSRANWQIIVSPLVLNELSATSDERLRRLLVGYGQEFLSLNRINGLTDDEYRHANDLSRRLEDSRWLKVLPDKNDRRLIGQAVGFGCDVFCTRDLKTIHSKRQNLEPLNLRILTPIEWWSYIKPWANLWY